MIVAYTSWSKIAQTPEILKEPAISMYEFRVSNCSKIQSTPGQQSLQGAVILSKLRFFLVAST
jgi:hypothetical protein